MGRETGHLSERRFIRMVSTRRRLLLSAAAGLVLLALLPGSMRSATRFLLAWDLTALIYVGFAFLMIARSTIETCRKRAAQYDESDVAIIVLVVMAAAASFGAIFNELTIVKVVPGRHVPSLLLAGGTVVLSWAFTHTVFTLHYANLYYRPAHDGPSGGLIFPGDRQPDYRDFLYYAFVVGCASQTGDVSTASPAMRLATLAHGIVAFSFNTAILALTINVGASLLF